MFYQGLHRTLLIVKQSTAIHPTNEEFATETAGEVTEVTGPDSLVLLPSITIIFLETRYLKRYNVTPDTQITKVFVCFAISEFIP